MPPPDPSDAWRFLWMGYLLTVTIETPVLLLGLSSRHPLRNRFFAGLWLTACTYPIVVLVLPYVVWAPLGHTAYLAIAETFAPVAECLLFWLVFGSRQERLIDLSDATAEHGFPGQDRPPVGRPRCILIPSHNSRGMFQDFATIIVANLASFLLGEWGLSSMLARWAS